MKVLINLSTLKKGGGQNVALNFLYSIKNLAFNDIQFCFLAAKNSTIHHWLEENKMEYTVSPSHPIKRIIFELFISQWHIKKMKADIIYSYFGIGLFKKSIPQVSGSADSNLFFPEIDFWQEYSGLKKVKKKIVDSYRIWGLKRANAIIFENEAMEKRSKILYNLPLTKTIKPSINFSEYFDHIHIPTNNKIIGLFLCGWQLNKGVMLIPELASEFKKAKINFHFILTAPQDSSEPHKKFIEQLRYFNVEDLVSITGQIKKSQIPSLYEKVDFVFLLSKLESFSNNIIEAWHFKKILVITDAEWSRAICRDAALYVNRDNPKEIVEKVSSHICNHEKATCLIDKGNVIIEDYPTISDRTKEELFFLREVYEKSKK